MKNIFIFFLLFSFSHVALCQTETPNTAPTPYDIKSGKITYRFVNGIQQGQKILIFDNYGREEKMIANSIVGGNISNSERNAGDTTHEMILKREGFIYKIDLSKGIGFKLNRNETLPLNLNSLRPGQVITGTDTVLDRECVVVEVFGSLKSCYWNRIPIKKQVIGTGMTTKIEDYAVSIDENYVPDKNEFEIPEGIKIK